GCPDRRNRRRSRLRGRWARRDSLRPSPGEVTMKRAVLVVLAASSTLMFAACRQQPAEEQLPATQEEALRVRTTATPTAAPVPMGTMVGMSPADAGVGGGADGAGGPGRPGQV